MALIKFGIVAIFIALIVVIALAILRDRARRKQEC
jgi:hypothetical protein